MTVALLAGEPEEIKRAVEHAHDRLRGVTKRGVSFWSEAINSLFRSAVTRRGDASSKLAAFRLGCSVPVLRVFWDAAGRDRDIVVNGGRFGDGTGTGDTLEPALEVATDATVVRWLIESCGADIFQFNGRLDRPYVIRNFLDAALKARPGGMDSWANATTDEWVELIRIGTDYGLLPTNPRPSFSFFVMPDAIRARLQSEFDRALVVAPRERDELIISACGVSFGQPPIDGSSPSAASSSSRLIRDLGGLIALYAAYDYHSLFHAWHERAIAKATESGGPQPRPYPHLWPGADLRYTPDAIMQRVRESKWNDAAARGPFDLYVWDGEFDPPSATASTSGVCMNTAAATSE